MKNYNHNQFLIDYDFATRVIENPDNERRHLLGLRMMIHNFETKYNEVYLEKKHYFIALHLKLDSLKTILKSK